jgi:hypothetical protein
MATSIKRLTGAAYKTAGCCSHHSPSRSWNHAAISFDQGLPGNSNDSTHPPFVRNGLILQRARMSSLEAMSGRYESRRGLGPAREDPSRFVSHRR